MKNRRSLLSLAAFGAAGLVAGCDTRSAQPGGSATAVSPTATPSNTPMPSAISPSATQPSATQPSATPTPSSSGALSDPEWDQVKNHWKDSDLVRYQGVVEHIFFHQMIPFPELAFDGDAMAQGFDDWFLTKREIIAIIKELHARDYVLVHLGEAFPTKNGKTTINQDFLVPRGKKPLVLSIDDLSFNRYLDGQGFMDRLTVTEQGRIGAIGKDPAGKVTTDATNTTPGFLDQFLRQNPDFSLRGATGTLALTGYEGVLGYRTERLNKNRGKELGPAKKMADTMRTYGWTFASHSYGHINLDEESVESIRIDTQKWLRYTAETLGSTPIYITPFGVRLAADSAKMKVLRDAGFSLLCPVSDRSAQTAFARQGVVINDRVHVDGIAMRAAPRILTKFFDPAKVVDRQYRTWAR